MDISGQLLFDSFDMCKKEDINTLNNTYSSGSNLHKIDFEDFFSDFNVFESILFK